MARLRQNTVARRASAWLAALVTIGLLSTGPAFADPTSPPDDDEVQSAREHESLLSIDVAVAEVELITLGTSLDSAWETAKAAGEDYLQAEQDVDDAKSVADQAQERLSTALENVEESRKVLAGIAMEQFRNGGSMSALEAVLSADGITEVIDRTNSLEIVNGIADSAVQQFKADSIVADTMQQRADDALAEAESAANQADAALTAADAAQADAESAMVDGEERRTELISTLATAHNTTVALETQIQDERDAERRARVEERARQDRENAAAESDATSPGAESSATQPGSQSTPSPAQTSTSTPAAPAPSTSGPAPESTPSRTSSPTPAPTTATPTTPAPTTPAPTTPVPTKTPTPKPTTPPQTGGGGTSVGSAAQGAAAVAWAKTKIGSPYGWGSTGPNSYDCSGLTSMAWRSQGVNITRTSRTQYNHVKKIPYSQMRPGDLIFYGSNPSNAQSITHVAIYAGNNKMVEARRPGVPLSVSPVRYSGTMTFAGRP